ncbi:signal peptidase [Aneurinibacillus migulanus]|uniref:signal peptidase I n=1 Tax=Aneurinibacillus migulanus TaxID=47500 RepID=UPI0005BDEE57|nr:signal peptidase I [Aneurinibacillus migulanus]KIV56096.1 signal peptidase [Aneurinibacillus migulanus]KPD07928.1 signal peptidase [Aneurinibacillus migulanus]MCP1358746.1 signal peptidase I [Aneurinibacillus migulanus]MED4727225.1 signal peptidase I [Aneurinibacillus migulanus]CEH29409.1 Signal peptidase I [Aneurinibacillus migulanus]
MKKVTSWISTIISAVLLCTVITAFVFQPTRVSGHSMEPTLYNKEFLILSKIPYTFNTEPNYGDIVVIDSRLYRERSLKDDIMETPLLNRLNGNSDHDFWIKRVVGKAGDILEFKNGNVYRNGKVLDEPYIKEKMDPEFNEKVTVPENNVFVMGDNRNHSNDSRVIGCIPLDHVLGKKLF